jgi:hypothetical protein
MNARTNAGRLLAGLAVGMLLVACSAGGAASTPTTATPDAVATPAVAVATPGSCPTAAPSPASDRTYVRGKMTCQIVGGDIHETPGDYTSYPLDLDCSLSMSDARVSGTAHYSTLATFISLEPTLEGTSNYWKSTSTLEAEGGTWTGSGYGSEFVSSLLDPGLTLYSNGTDVFVGQGSFEGLRFVALWSMGRELDLIDPRSGYGYRVSGWIEPAQ